jgi:NADPH:quinone reductase-like Zn-dependent oxidoreductase
VDSLISLFAGVILDVGPDVTDFEMGDEVWGCVSEWAGGAASELLTVRRFVMEANHRYFLLLIPVSGDGITCILLPIIPAML